MRTPTTRRRAPLRRTLVAGIVVAVVGLSACGGEDDGSSLPEMEPTEATTGSALDRIPDGAPRAPQAQRSTEGAIAFSEHVMTMIAYTIATNDTAPFEQIADLDRCQICTQVIEESKEMTMVQVLDGDPELGEAEIVDTDDDFVTIRRDVVIPSGQQIDPDSGEIDKELSSLEYDTTFNLRWTDGAWHVLRIIYRE